MSAGIEYSLVARGATILCSYQRGTSSSNFDAAADSMLGNIPTHSNTKTTYSSNEHHFHVIVQSGMIYMCAAQPDYRKNRAYAFLDEIVSRFTGGSLIVRSSTASHMELQRDFSNVLSSQMNKFSKDEGDNITQLQAQVNDVKGVMTQNIEKVLQRGEKLEDLMEKTDDLTAHSLSFKKTTRQIARKYWWQNLRMKFIIAAVVIVLLAVITLIILGSLGLLKPGGGKDETTTTAPSTTASVG